MNGEILISFLLMGIGSLLIFVGLMHKIPLLSHWDTRTFQFLHTHLRSCTGFFRYIWPLGTTPVGITLILITFIASWQAGLIVAVLYTIMAILERTVKLKVARPRPFETLPNVAMDQPKEPHDPSHPSGDTMRGFFLALVFPWAFALPWPVYALTLITAAILSLGRIILGVHYPMDVIGGAGLGILGAGITVICYQVVFAL